MERTNFTHVSKKYDEQRKFELQTGNRIREKEKKANEGLTKMKFLDRSTKTAKSPHNIFFPNFKNFLFWSWGVTKASTFL